VFSRLDLLCIIQDTQITDTHNYQRYEKSLELKNSRVNDEIPLEILKIIMPLIVSLLTYMWVIPCQVNQ